MIRRGSEKESKETDCILENRFIYPAGWRELRTIHVALFTRLSSETEPSESVPRYAIADRTCKVQNKVLTSQGRVPYRKRYCVSPSLSWAQCGSCWNKQCTLSNKIPHTLGFCAHSSPISYYDTHHLRSSHVRTWFSKPYGATSPMISFEPAIANFVTDSAIQLSCPRRPLALPYQRRDLDPVRASSPYRRK